MPRHVTLSDFLTTDQLKAAVKLWRDDRYNFHRRVLAEVVEPNMAEINRKLGQDNVPGYIAYVIEYAMMGAERP